ncbi:putative ADP-ribosylation factor GTPase-activating protein AGD14 [Helianthus annuus]|nr:putative ADP-ribosylation factor GTPase-activating protein AGD14 [Helianthus annuus]
MLGEAEGSRSPPFRDGRNSEDGKLSNGGFKVDDKSPDHQRDPDISSPPVIRPVRDILGDKASPVRIEPPKSNGSLRTQVSLIRLLCGLLGLLILDYIIMAHGLS